jgi:hypothetical protein
MPGSPTVRRFRAVSRGVAFPRPRIALLLLPLAAATALAQAPVDLAVPGGSLRRLVPEQVGVFKLGTISGVPEALAMGATDALVASYSAPDSGEVALMLSAFPSPATNQEAMDELVRLMTGDQGFTSAAEGNVSGAGGAQVGKYARLESATEEAIVWTNGNLLTWIYGPLGTALNFHKIYPNGLGPLS